MAVSAVDGIGQSESFIIIGIPGNRRTTGLQQARQRLGLPPALVVSYEALLGGKGLEECLPVHTLTDGCSPTLRLDSPGECFQVERGLLSWGAPDADMARSDDALHPFASRMDPYPMSIRQTAALQEQKGRIWHPSQWYRGYIRLLGRLRSEAAQLWQAPRWMNDPADIACMTDKRCTQRRLAEAGLPIPRPLSEANTIADYEELRAAMLRQRMPRVFIKLAYGSGASGIVAYQVHPATGAEIAQTTVSVSYGFNRPPIFYNTGKLIRYIDSGMIRIVINEMLRHGAHIEQWIAKASYGARVFDIRQLVVMGEACHNTARVSSTPITNLHLRSERMTPAQVGVPPAALAELKNVSEKAMRAFHQSAVAGIDILVRSGDYAPQIVDVNPFGDLLYHVEHEGLDPYEWQMKRWHNTITTIKAGMP